MDIGWHCWCISFDGFVFILFFLGIDAGSHVFSYWNMGTRKPHLRLLQVFYLHTGKWIAYVFGNPGVILYAWEQYRNIHVRLPAIVRYYHVFTGLDIVNAGISNCFFGQIACCSIAQLVA